MVGLELCLDGWKNKAMLIVVYFCRVLRLCCAGYNLGVQEQMLQILMGT